MKLSKYVLSFVCFALACVAPVAAQTKQNPQTVLDYYLLLPKSALSILENTKKTRKALIEKQDLANGYIALNGDEMEGGAQVALFRKKNREAVIGVSEWSCGPACMGGVKFMQYNAGKWRDVTDRVLPETTDEEILAAYNRIKTEEDDQHSLDDPPYVYWELPRKGTIVALVLGDAGESTEAVLINFAWNGERFTKTAKQKNNP